MAKVKTSIYVDSDLWSTFKEYASRKGSEVGKILEELIKDAVIEGEIDKEFSKIGDDYEIDFDPMEPKEGSISGLVRVMRDERTNSLSRQ